MFAFVTQADGSSRGNPWVSYALAALLLGSFVFFRLGEAGQEAMQAELQLDEAVAYFQEHPYLDLDARLIDRAGGVEATETARDEFTADRRDRGLSLIPRSIKRRGQHKLDAMVDEAFERVRALPGWSLGVVDDQSPASNFLVHFVVHDGIATLLVSLLFLLCLGIALEDVWGAALFAPFCAVSILAGGIGYRALYPELGLPWAGAGGLCAALLGAYFIQAIRWPALLLGALPLPGWLLTLTWVGCEYGVARGWRFDGTDGMPFALHGALFAFGAVTALAMRQLGVEEKLRARDDKASELLANPTLDGAMAAHEAGRSEEAFGLLEAEHAKAPGQRDVAIGFWTVAAACGRTAQAIPAMTEVIRQELKSGKQAEAVSHWKELAPALDPSAADPALMVRLGETLVRAGEPQEATLALALAVDTPKALASAIAIRAVRIARDLDPALAGRAAARALEDPQLDPGRRDEMQALAADASEAPAIPAARPAPPPAAVPAPAATAAPAGTPEAMTREAAPPRGAESDGLDALSLSEEIESAASADAGEVERWNAPGLVEDLSVELEDEALDLVSLEPTGEGAVATETPDGAYDPTNYGTVNLDEHASEDETTAPVPETTTPDERPTAVELDETDVEEIELGSSAPRVLKLLEGAPLSITNELIELEVTGRGKTNVPFERLEALAVAAVGGLSDRPVLVVDLVLNWMSLADEPLKVIRLRSDRFNPLKLVSGAESPLDALKRLLETLAERSGATPLPDAGAARGDPFASFDDLASYQRDVLMVHED